MKSTFIFDKYDMKTYCHMMEDEQIVSSGMTVCTS